MKIVLLVSNSSGVYRQNTSVNTVRPATKNIQVCLPGTRTSFQATQSRNCQRKVGLKLYTGKDSNVKFLKNLAPRGITVETCILYGQQKLRGNFASWVSSSFHLDDVHRDRKMRSFHEEQERRIQNNGFLAIRISDVVKNGTARLHEKMTEDLCRIFNELPIRRSSNTFLGRK